MRHAAVGSTLLIAAALLLGGAAQPAVASDDETEEPWQRIIQRMIDGAREQPYSGRVVVVSFEPGGPNVGEIAVARTEDGTMMSDHTRSWMIGQRRGETMLADVEAGRLFRLASAQRGIVSVTELSRNYRVEVEEAMSSVAGMETVVVALTARGADSVRERLHIERDTGLVLRRESFDRRGEPYRLVVYTTIELGSDDMPEVGSGWVKEEVEPVRVDVSERGMEIFRQTGWIVPQQLHGGFRLLDAGAVGDGSGEESSLHLLYSDGLYALSVYEQEGRLDERTVREAGASRVDLDGLGAYRWPGSEPAVFSWTAEGMTFTVVSDAPPDVLAAAVSVFPQERPSRLTDRVRRGLSRTLDILWPFG